MTGPGREYQRTGIRPADGAAPADQAPATSAGPPAPAVFAGPPAPAVFAGPLAPAVFAGPLAPAVFAGPLAHGFAHASEAELARILDFYGVAWRYEPDTFPIGWNLDGDVVESFSPDFYLPDLDLYVELTTLKQKLVRKKNRKLRRLRELYPDVRIKLFYARDFRMLLLKFGRMALVDELTGTTGQATPPRSTAARREASAAIEHAAAAPVSGPIEVAAERVEDAAPAAVATSAIPPAEQRGRRRGRRRRRTPDSAPAPSGAESGIDAT